MPATAVVDSGLPAALFLASVRPQIRSQQQFAQLENLAMKVPSLVLYYVLCVLFESSGESLRFDYFQRQVMHITMLALKVRILLTKVNGLMSGKRTCSTFFPSS